MKIVLVQPNVGFQGHTWEALGIGYIIAYLRKHFDGELDIEFYSGFYDSDDAIIQAASSADIIGFGCTSPQYRHALDLARRIKTGDNLIVFGGIHPSALPELVLKEECVDTVVIGEGEKAMLQLVEDVAKGVDIRQQRYLADYIKDLDELPFPDRVTIKNERNISQAVKDEGLRITSVLSSRGCPFRCGFCCSHILWERRLRFRTPSNILDEVAGLVRDWDIQFLKFADDTFTLNKQMVIEFCKLKIARGIKVPYGANAHVNTVDEEMLRYLAESGCQELWYGVESGSPRILREMHKSTDVSRIKKTFNLTKSHGIKTRAYFLLGMPGETIEDIAMTEELCDELRPDIVGFTLLAPFPSNEYFDYKTMADWDWSTFDEYNNDWVHTATITNRELKEIQRRLVAKYQKVAAFRQRSKKRTSQEAG
jgi:radical SAM superfamily enzyme YgiQ (UPF0313 family)